MKRLLVLLCAMTLVFGVVGAAVAVPIDVLWYGGSTTYNTFATNFSTNAGWTLSIWSDGDPTPTFSDYDVFVIGTADDGFGTGMDPTRLLGAGASIAAARGDRTVITGQDVDWHGGFVITTLPGAVTLLENAVEWAADGTGLGIVSMVDGWTETGSQWWLSDGSFLKDELTGYVNYQQSEIVTIAPGTETHPVNLGLTSALLSNWGTSAHEATFTSIPGYIALSLMNGDDDLGVTIATSVPDAGIMWLLGSSLLGLGLLSRRRK